MPPISFPGVPDVFSAAELGRATGVSAQSVRDLIADGEINTIDGEHVAEHDARAALQAITRWRAAGSIHQRPGLFSSQAPATRHTGVPLALSSTLHVLIMAGAMFLTTVGLDSVESEKPADPETQPMRLVFLALPGPGGGGGGGGLKQMARPPKAERKGTNRLSSPLPPRQPPKLATPTAQIEQPKPVLEHEPLPPIVAPVATAPADGRDRVGALEESSEQAESRGPGNGGGVGAGSGTGIGEGDGTGIGPGSGGGTGGGPYRPGSGIEPPRLLREVKPDYTEEARQRGIEGDVLMEIVVRYNGSVGDVRLLSSLGYGLDRRAIDAVRQWRFTPARRLGTPVDVLVEVAVEFKLR